MRDNCLGLVMVVHSRLKPSPLLLALNNRVVEALLLHLDGGLLDLGVHILDFELDTLVLLLLLLELLF